MIRRFARPAVYPDQAADLLDLAARGWSLTLLRPRSKAPQLKGWERCGVPIEEVQRHVQAGGNVGVVLGAPSGGLVDVDLDAAEARALAADWLPETSRQFGREGSGISHRCYLVADPAKTIRLFDPVERGVLVELRGSGAQTMIPPSLHPNGELIRWAEKGDPATTTWRALLGKVHHLGAAALLARYWPREPGSRHDLALALAGLLLRGGVTLETAERLVVGAATTAGDPEASDRARAVRDTAGRLKSGERVTGAPTLQELLHPRVVGTMRRWLELTSGGGPSDTRADRVEVLVGPDEHRVNDEAMAALAAEPSIYARGQRLVRVVRPREGGTPKIQELPSWSLRELLTRHIRFSSETKDGQKVVHPPDWCVAALCARADWPGVRHLSGVVVSPTMRPDGTILHQPGFDPATGLLLEPTCPVLAVPENPTPAEVRIALEALQEVVCDVPFALPAHRSGWLAAVLTMFARHAIPGNVPAILIDANARGSGKGLVADSVAIIGLGNTMPRSPQPKDDEEMRKGIMAVALAGTPAVLFDNATSKFAYRSFDAAVTCNGCWDDRMLGKSERRTLPLPTIWFITANNLSLSSDTARRVLPIRLLSPIEHPEDRSDFTHPDLLRWVVANRPRLAQAALTILRAFVMAGRPQTDLPRWGSFEAWSGWIRQCIVWLGLPDPFDARPELRDRADVDRDAMSSLLAAMEEVAVGDFTAVELVDLAKSNPNLLAALVELCPPRSGDSFPTTQRVAALFRSLRDRVIAGRRLEGRPGHAGTMRWWVRRSDEGAERASHCHQRHQASDTAGESGEDGDCQHRSDEGVE